MDIVKEGAKEEVKYIFEIDKRLQQRPPFQMIEKIVEIRDGEYAKGIKNVSINFYIFSCHST